MDGKITTVLTKREAEAYRSQGLHNEALRLYQNLLASSPHLGASFKDAIQGQVAAIQTELDVGPAQENKMLSAAEIKRIKKSWGTMATESDLLVCAQAFCQVGHFQDALVEAARLLQKGCAIKKVVSVLAHCLVQLRTPEQLAESIGSFGEKIFKPREARCRFYLMLTEEMIRQKQRDHALALYACLQKNPVIRQKAPQRLEGIGSTIERLTMDDAKDMQEQRSKSASASKAANAMAPHPEETPPLVSKAGKKNPLGWLPFFKKHNPKNA